MDRVTVLGLCVCVRVCVCLSVDAYSHTTGHEAARERYQRLQNYANRKNIPKTTAFQRYAMKQAKKKMSTCIIALGLPRPIRLSLCVPWKHKEPRRRVLTNAWNLLL